MLSFLLKEAPKGSTDPSERFRPQPHIKLKTNMKHNALTALSMAAALVVAGSAQASEFSIDFEAAGYALTPANNWTQAQDDYSAIVATNNALDANSTKSLLLDTGDAELSYAVTNVSDDVTILTMDVFFVGTDTAPDTTGFTGQTMVYLDTSGNDPVLKAYTAAEAGWVTLPTAATITDGSWHTIQMAFSASEVEYSIDGTAATNLTLTSFTKVQSVGFKGTGMVDNFVGDKAGIPGATDDGTGEQASNSATYENGVVTGAFETTLNGDDLEFIRVFDSSDNYVTLRYSNSQAITLPAGFTPAKVVAYYGDDVSAVPDNMTVTAESVSVDTTGAQAQIKVEIDGLVSGVYYKVVDADSGTTLASKLVAPAEEGGETVFSFAPDSTAWGVKKFKVVVDDEL